MLFSRFRLQGTQHDRPKTRWPDIDSWAASLGLSCPLWFLCHRGPESVWCWEQRAAGQASREFLVQHLLPSCVLGSFPLNSQEGKDSHRGRETGGPPQPLHQTSPKETLEGQEGETARRNSGSLERHSPPPWCWWAPLRQAAQPAVDAGLRMWF